VIGQVTSLRDIQTVQLNSAYWTAVTNAFDASLILFNPECPEALALTNVPNNELALALIDPKKDKRVTRYQVDDWNDMDIKSISEITMAKMIQIGAGFTKAMTVKRAILIKSKSENLASNEKPVFWCTSCRTNVTSVSPKFKLHLVVKDDTSTCKLMILDTIESLSDVKQKSFRMIEDPDVLPQPIKDLVGLSFCFGVTLGSKNVSVLSGDMLLQIETNSEPITHVTDGSSIMSCGECLHQKRTVRVQKKVPQPHSQSAKKNINLIRLQLRKKFVPKSSRWRRSKMISWKRNEKETKLIQHDKESKTRRKQNSGNWMQVDRNVNRKSVRSLDVPVSSVFKRLFQDVVDTTNDAVPPSNQGKLLTPYTPRNISKCFKIGVDSGTGQASARKFTNKLYHIFSIFQPDFDCSSQENTDSESEPEIEVVDLTVDTEPYTVLKTNIVKSLAALFEEAFCATEKPAKKALPKED
ncbi:LOW QUALITY PROTEIN: hypothetical protein HID58_070203, partial [Brassica napus]